MLIEQELKNWRTQEIRSSGVTGVQESGVTGAEDPGLRHRLDSIALAYATVDLNFGKSAEFVDRQKIELTAGQVNTTR